jgi:hypothetical protein
VEIQLLVRPDIQFESGTDPGERAVQLLGWILSGDRLSEISILAGLPGGI